MPTAQFNMRLDTELKRKLDEAALLDRRSTAALVTIILDSWLDGKLYPTAFDATKIGGADTAQRLRPPPGRPRTRKRSGANTTAFIGKASRWLADRTEATASDLIDGAFPTERDNPNVGHGLPVIIREVFLDLGWIERVNLQGERVWIKLSD